MENFSYHVPFYIATAGVATQGQSSELGSGQVGFFDRNTWGVVTPSNNGEEFFFAQGVIGGKDWYGNPYSQKSHKSPFFYSKDIQNFYKSLPAKIKNEKHVVGFNGSPSSKSLVYRKGKSTRIQIDLFDGPVYRMFGGPKSFTISYSPEINCPDACVADCNDDCSSDCLDCAKHTALHVDLINNHPDLSKLGVRASVLNSPYTASTFTMLKYKVCLCDEGDAVALQNVQNKYPGKTISRISREGSTSCYEFCQKITDAAPAPVQLASYVSLATCGTCPAGWTSVAEKKIMVVKRPLAGTEVLVTDANKQTYATSVGTSYLATVATYIGHDVSGVTVKLEVPAIVPSALADAVVSTSTEAARCVSPVGATVAWVAGEQGISGTRSLRINGLNRPDCNTPVDRLAELTTILSGVPGIVIASLAKVAGVNCVDDYTVDQESNDCLTEECLSNQKSFVFASVPGVDGKVWEIVVDNTVVTPGTNKCGILVEAAFYDPKFGNCSFNPSDFYETKPIRMEVSVLSEGEDACSFKNLPSIHKRQIGQLSRQSGEWVVREAIDKFKAYQGDNIQFDLNPRWREAMGQNLLSMVDRNAFYVLYYVTFKSSYGVYTKRNPSARDTFTAIFAFKENDPAQYTFESQIGNLLVAKSGVAFHTIG